MSNPTTNTEVDSQQEDQEVGLNDGELEGDTKEANATSYGAEQLEVTEAERLDILKAQADELNIAYSNNIGFDTLSARIRAELQKHVIEDAKAALEARQAQREEIERAAQERATNGLAKPLNIEERAMKQRNALIQDATKLVRCRISNHHPNKKALKGEVFTVVNDLIGTIRKYVPYEVEDDLGWHIPYCIYLQLKDRKFQQIKVEKDPNTRRDTQRMTLVKEFTIDVLPQLTQEEINELKAIQLKLGNTD